MRCLSLKCKHYQIVHYYEVHYCHCSSLHPLPLSPSWDHCQAQGLSLTIKTFIKTTFHDSRKLKLHNQDPRFLDQLSFHRQELDMKALVAQYAMESTEQAYLHPLQTITLVSINWLCKLHWHNSTYLRRRKSICNGFRIFCSGTLHFDFHMHRL